MILYLDFSKKWQLGFQDPATMIMDGIINLHHYILFFDIIVFIFVFYIFLETLNFTTWYRKALFVKKFFISKVDSSQLLYKVYKENDLKRKASFNKVLLKMYNLDVTHWSLLEVIWTIIPSLILLLIVIPSFSLLYEIDTMTDPEITVKVMGHQWYWSYEYTDNIINFKNNLGNNVINFDSYMKPVNDLSKGELRLLEADTPLLLPIYTKIRINITSDDVLHCFAVPSLGLKVDACPGRLNVLYCEILREGIFFGQCSEICGVYHGFMPIKIYAVPLSMFYWYNISYFADNLDFYVFISDFEFDGYDREEISKYLIDNKSLLSN